MINIFEEQSLNNLSSFRISQQKGCLQHQGSQQYHLTYNNHNNRPNNKLLKFNHFHHAGHNEYTLNLTNLFYPKNNVISV